MDFVYLLVGVLLLTAGGEALIRGALGAARRLRVSPLLSGLVIVGFGTSAPELAVSVDAAMSGQPDLAVGNVVGSNIGNILLILGLCAVITPLTVQPLAVRRDATAVVLSSALLPVLTFGGLLTRLDGLVLMAILGGYLVWAWRTEQAPAEPAAAMHTQEADELNTLPTSVPLTAAAVVFGLVLLVGGSQVLLPGAVGIASGLGLSEAVIGLTLVAVGTSLPELSISVIAALRGHADVAVGNVLGSNIFNLLGILGLAAVIQPLPIAGRILAFDQWVMLATAALVLAFLYTARRVSRREGALLLAGYAAYAGASFTFLA